MDSEFPNPDDLRAEFERAGLAARYELLDEVGRGGMGVVYRGRHKLLGNIVAIKFHALRERADRFQREAQLLASIRSPHVVPVQDLELLPSGQAMLVMGWIDGSDLGRLPLDSADPVLETRAVSWMIDVCEGMQAAAEQGIVHRDLKPSNILVDQKDKAYVADFGLARSGRGDPLTLTGGVMGTPHYMAPEQAEDPRTVDTRADIYSFGATFYHVLTRQPPFAGESWFSILFRHKTEPLVSPRSRNPALSTRLSDCLERCLAKSPRDRFQTFADIVEHLRLGAESAAPWNQTDDPIVKQQQQEYLSRKPIYLSGNPSELPHPDRFYFPHDRMCTIGFGNLIEQRVDAVVSSDDQLLSMGGGVSLELARAAGADYIIEARKLAPARPGRAVATPAGRLPAKFVLHGITMGTWGATWVHPSRDLLNEILESCFYHADTLGLRSIAFPLLATGAGRFSREICLDTIFNFLARKLTHSLTTVQEARIVLFSPRPNE